MYLNVQGKLEETNAIYMTEQELVKSEVTNVKFLTLPANRKRKELSLKEQYLTKHKPRTRLNKAQFKTVQFLVQIVKNSRVRENEKH